MARYSAVESCTSNASDAAAQWLGRFGPQPSQQTLINGGAASGTASIHTCVYQGIEAVSEGHADITRVCRSNTTGQEFVQFRFQFKPTPCGLVDYSDALVLAWGVVAVWLAAYALKFLGRIVRDR